MTVNLSARNYRLTIAGLDCTVLLVSVDGGYSHYDSSGLILIDATLILRRTLDWVEELDDRTNPRWARGNQIDLKISDSTGVLRPAPVLGRLYILKAEYDGRRELKIEAGCLLNLLNFRTPAGDGACLNLGEQKALGAIGAKLLQKAGIFSWSGFVSGAPLTTPIPKLTNESYVQLFGKLCYANGQFAYQDNLGVVRVEPVRLFPPSTKTFVIGRDDAQYQRLTGVESPCEIIRVTGTISKTTKTSPYYRSVSEDYQTQSGGAVKLTGKTIYQENLQFSQRKKSAKTEVYKPHEFIFGSSVTRTLALAEKNEEVSFYEQATPFSEDNCDTLDEGRLIRKEILIYKPLYAAMTAWYEGWLSFFPSVRGEELILAEKVISTYRYTKPGTVYAMRGADEASSLAELPKPKIEPYFVTETYKTIGELLPDDLHPNLARVKELALAGRTIESWDEFRKSEWEKETTVYQFFGNTIVSNVSLTSVTITRKLELTLKSRKVERSNSGQATPPAPERFPSPYTVEEEAVNVKVQMPPVFGASTRRPREKEIVLDGGFLTSKAQALSVGRIEGHILHGKHKGQTCSVAVTDEMFAIKPLAGVHWLDKNRAHLFMADGIALAFVNNRLALSFDGIWSGTTAVNIPPDTLPDDIPAIINETIDRDGVAPPYSEIREIELGSGSGLDLKFFPYSVQPKLVDAFFGSGSGFLPLKSTEIKNIEISSGSGFLFLKDSEVKKVEIASGSGFASPSFRGVILGSGSGFSRTNTPTRNIDFGSGSGFFANPEVALLASGTGFDTDELVVATDNFSSGSSLNIAVSPSVSVEFGSGGFLPIDLLSAPNISVGSGSRLEIAIPPSVDIDFGGGGGIDVTLPPSFDLPMASGSSIEIDELALPSFAVGSASGFDVAVSPSVDIELGGGLGIDVALEPSTEIEFNSGSGIDTSLLSIPNAQIQSGGGFAVTLTNAKSIYYGDGSGFGSSILATPNTSMGKGSGLLTDSFDSRLVAHTGEPLVTHTGARLVSYNRDMSYLALEHEVIDYKNRLLSAGGSIGFADLVAHNILVKDLKAANIWSRIHELYSFSGNNLASALVKFKYLSQSNLTNVGIPASNYNKYIGLRGGSNSTYLLTGYNPRQSLNNNSNQHFSVEMQKVPTSTGYYFGCTNPNTVNRFGLQNANANLNSYSGFGINTLAIGGGHRSFVCASSLGGIGVLGYVRGFQKSSSLTNTAGAIPNTEMAIFTRNGESMSSWFANFTIRFFSIGLGLSYPEMIIFEEAVGRFTAALGRS